MKISKNLPAIFHNLRGYDGNLIIKELSKSKCNINVIPNGLEKFMSFSLGKNIVFIDSILFFNSSLDKLVNNLNEFKDLPDKECFFNSLKSCSISDKEYKNKN